MVAFIRNLLKISKPMLIVANKADLPNSKENIERIKEKYPNVIPTSAESELALSRANEANLINYVPGASDFEILNKEALNDNQLKALNYIKENVLDVYGSTGVQNALNTAIFELLNMIVVYPVEDEHKLSDQKGNVLPDAILIPNGSIPRDLAYIIHTDIGDKFMHGIDVRRKMRVASDYVLSNGDIINIITH